MNTSLESTNENRHSSCPSSTIEARNALGADDKLIFPMNKRVIVQYSSDASGSRELHIYYGDKEISFDEPDLFDFGENLAKQSSFVARTATCWGKGYEWPRIQLLLEQLVEAGILKHADDCLPEAAPAQERLLTSPLPPAYTRVSRSWLECESISRVLTGQTLELSYLELVIPIFRVAHISMDSEGRQIGEANVFPKSLRIDVPTEWRRCPYPGSRYMDERPMNVTALKSMRTHWPQMMVALLHIRNAYMQRYPLMQHGWTVGGLEALSTLVLAVPTYLLMRKRKRVPNGELHPALSSMFRITDGLRLTMHKMIFVPFVEPTLPAGAPMTSTEIYEYSERNHSFLSDHGVCAGPKAMIEEFFNVLVDGVPIKDASSVVLDPQIQAALEDINPAFDYGLLGLQAFSVIFSAWPVMARTYEQLGQIVDSWSGETTNTLIQFRERMQTQVNILKTETYLATEEWRINREQAYSAIYEHCAIGLGLPSGEKTLTERIAPAMESCHKRVLKQLRNILQQQCAPSESLKNPELNDLLHCIMNYFLQMQAILRLASETQQSINTLLGRALPLSSFSTADMNTHNLLRGDPENRLSHLINELEETLSIRIAITKEHIVIKETNILEQV
jgi:hypothetical protein